MAEPLRNDQPLSDVRFPESPTTNAARPVPGSRVGEPAGLIPDTLPDRPLGAWPESDDAEGTPLDNAGERVGSAIGAVVNQTKELGGMMQDRMSELKRKFRVIAGRRSAELKQKSTELSDEAQQKVAEIAEEARREVRLWEFRARVYARDSPFQLIGGAAVAGFVIGFLLRLWRDE